MPPTGAQQPPGGSGPEAIIGVLGRPAALYHAPKSPFGIAASHRRAHRLEIRVDVMDHAHQATLTFRCPRELDDILPRPIPAVYGMPDWFKALPQKAFNPTMGAEAQTVKKCPPFIDAMTHGFLILLPIDLEVRDGEFSWSFDVPEGFVSEYSHSPIGFHDSSQIAGTPFFDEDRFIIKFNNFWNIEAPPGYSILFTHPVNRADLPFTTLTGLVDCDTFHDSPVNFPARWHDAAFDGILPKGTPVAQCLPIRRESWTSRFETFSTQEAEQMIRTREAIGQDADVYRRHFRMPKR